MKKLMLTAAVLGAFSVSARAQTADAAAAPAATPEHTFTANVAVVSDYRFRGISQTYKRYIADRCSCDHAPCEKDVGIGVDL